MRNRVLSPLSPPPTYSVSLCFSRARSYDEHGGFADHVRPPSKNVPNPDGINAPNGFKFDRLGVRVPTLAISPWIDANTVVTGTRRRRGVLCFILFYLFIY